MNTRPHYADIARHLTDAITTGHFPVGSLLPTELELCEHYGTSRHTVRAALQELQRLGLVSRRKNVGTRVESNRPVTPFRPTLASVDDLVQFGERHMRVVQEIAPVVVDAALAAELGCEAGTRWLRVSSLRRNGSPDAPPIGWTDVYVDPAYADVGELARQSPDVLISDLIEQRHGVSIEEIQQDVRACTVDARLAGALGLQAGAAGLKILRRYLDRNARAFEISVTVHPAARFSVSMRLRRSHAG